MKASAVLFDFDGTFADTAPDLGAALNRLRAEQGLEPMPIERLRPFASAGARGMLAASFGMKPDHAEYEAMRTAFLEFYGERTCVDTCLFPGIADLLDELGARRIAWGIVTNKSLRFTEKILLELGAKPDCVVAGDTTPHLKPHPEPLLHAARQLKLAPEACWYLGDDLRDMQAARAAGMRAIAVNWGYHHPDSGLPGTWQAAAVIDAPLDLLAHLGNGT